LPCCLGALAKQLDLAEEAALAPYKGAVAVRKEKARLAEEKEAQHRAADFKASLELGHISRYLKRNTNLTTAIGGSVGKPTGSGH
jgi:hypothetical protein